MWQFIELNKRKTIILLIVLTLFLVGFSTLLGLYITGTTDGVEIGLIIGIICTIGIIFYAKFNASKFFLDQVNAVPVKKGEMPVLENITEEMSIASALGFVPKIFLVNSPYPNAFSVGINRENAGIAVTTSLLSLLNRDELTGVIAHEIAHIKNQDTLYLMYAGVIFGVIVAISDTLLRSFRYSSTRRSSNRNEGGGEAVILLIIILFAILSPICVRLLYFSLSRKREFLADASACQYTRFPTGLASALYKISNFTITGKKREDEGSNQLIQCMYIHNRLQTAENFFSNLFATHPPVEKRIEVLKKMGAADIKEYTRAYSTVTGDKKLITNKNLMKMNIETLAIASAIADDAEEKKINKQRQAKNAYYNAQNYTIINCECGTILKIPPEIKRKSVQCPHCKKNYTK